MTSFLPIDPLLDLYPRLTAGALADLAETDRSGFNRAISHGHLRWDLADKVAIRLGLHPVLIWPDEWPLHHHKSDHGARRYLARIRQEMAS